MGCGGALERFKTNDVMSDHPNRIETFRCRGPIAYVSRTSKDLFLAAP